MADPEKTGEEQPTVVEGEQVSISKAELDELRKVQSGYGYATRKWQEEREKLMAQVEAKSIETGNKDLDAIRIQVMAKEKAIEAREKAAEAKELQEMAVRYATDNQVDSSELTGCKTELEIKAKVLDLTSGRKPAAKGIDLGRGGAGAQSDDQFLNEYGKADSKYNSPQDHARARKIMQEKGLLR